MTLVPRPSRLIAAATGAVLVLTGIPATAAPSEPAAGAGPATATEPAEPAPDPVRPGPARQTIELAPAAGASPTGRAFDAPDRAEAAAGARAVTGRTTDPFSLIGATWADPGATLGRTVEVRTRSVAGGRWTGWQTLESDGRSPADPDSADGGGRGRTDPLWVGTSDAVEARVAAGATALPTGLRLDLINPDATAAPPAGRATAAPPRPMPRMVTRSGWGANEAIVEDPPEYTPDVQVMFVHHTAGTNSYSCRDSARIIRGIEGYHVRSNGWNDIGYNFLVDRCGTLFEGRKGGAGRAVLGAHTMGFNSHSSAIAVLGNYDGRAVPTVVRNVIAQVAAYKLGAYGNLATGRTMLRSSGSDRYPKGTLASLMRVSGHRDTGRTECPGDALYGRLASIRSVAGAGPAGLRLLRMTGAVASGPAYYTSGLISPLWSTTTPSGLLNRFDLYVDGRLALSARNTDRKGTLRLSPGRHTVTVRAVHLSGRTASFTTTVIADSTAPAFAMGPSVVLRRGSMNGSVPVRVGWSATDTGGLRSVALTRPRALNLGVTANGWNTSAAPGAPTTWSLLAADRAGNTRAASVTRTPVVLSEAVASRTGSWVTLSDPAHLSGSAMRSTTARSSLSWTFTGRSAALAVSRGTASGQVTVLVDGRTTVALDLRSPALAHRQAVWVTNFGQSGQHTVKVVVTGTAGRPGVILDGLTVLR